MPPIKAKSSTVESSGENAGSESGTMSHMEGCFKLSDFWDSYDQWSACGVGVPIRLPNGDCLMQYYWPSLSALQLFTRRKIRIPMMKARSATKSESNAFTGEKIKSSSDNHPSLETDEIIILGNTEEVGELCCQYNDIVNPYGRPPLTERVRSLIERYPELVTLKSSDLTSHSWVAVAWYPVYRVPISTVKELNASFMTFHKLSSASPCTKRMLPVVETENIKREKMQLAGKKAGGEAKSRLPHTAVIPPFAMSTYRMSGEVWFSPGTDDLQMAIYYQQTAWRWIKQHKFKHHDFNFFMSRGIRS
ncbi:uncharacterized protein LOC116198056 isoform X2 [Punica granatum]|uniref:Uncharacterized protein LOC116198056 isoform X2 n=1 Tax=Punica granatum TaxID=22663 RepID=A0A6P8CS79_PUNGR|nr:uncharacterized protein LOC116198056 isoform X2 [Punica granatum]